MSWLDATITIVGVVGASVLVVAFLKTKGPWQGADTGSQPNRRTRTDDLHDGADRPAGPAAETMDPDRLGGSHRPPQ